METPLKYTKESQIETREDVTAFIKHLINDLEINWHPDDDAADYISEDTGEPTFTPEQAETVNFLTQKCFDVAQEIKGDTEFVYEAGFELLMNYLGIKE